MNSRVNYQSGIVSIVMIVVTLLFIALFASALLIHDSVNGTHLIKLGMGLMIIGAWWIRSGRESSVESRSPDSFGRWGKRR